MKSNEIVLLGVIVTLLNKLNTNEITISLKEFTDTLKHSDNGMLSTEVIGKDFQIKFVKLNEINNRSDLS